MAPPKEVRFQKMEPEGFIRLFWKSSFRKKKIFFVSKISLADGNETVRPVKLDKPAAGELRKRELKKVFGRVTSPFFRNPFYWLVLLIAHISKNTCRRRLFHLPLCKLLQMEKMMPNFKNSTLRSRLSDILKWGSNWGSYTGLPSRLFDFSRPKKPWPWVYLRCFSCNSLFFL